MVQDVDKRSGETYIGYFKNLIVVSGFFPLWYSLCHEYHLPPEGFMASRGPNS